MTARKACIPILIISLCLAMLVPALAFGADNVYTLSSSTKATTAKTYKIKSINGSTAIDTAIAIAKTAYPSGVKSGKAIVVSSGAEAWSDTVAASSLAGAIDCPILYVSQGSLPSATAKALTQLKVKHVYIVGGPAAVSESVATALKGKGFGVSRIAGKTFVDTQLAIYNFGKSKGIWNTSTAIVATGKTYEDSLAAGPVAFKKKYPIFYVPTSGSFTDDQMNALKNSKISTFYIIGGNLAVTKKLESTLVTIAKANAKKTGSTYRVERKRGTTAYATSKAVAEWAVGKGFLSWNNTAFATGTSSLDSAPGSVLQGKTGAPILWVSDTDTTSIAALKGKGVTSLRVFGGKMAVSPYVRNEIAMQLGFKLSDIQGFKVYIDAGHGQDNTLVGRYDPGAGGCKYDGKAYSEADENRALARSVAKKLEAQGIDYYLNDDGGLLALRHAEAIQQRCNVVISIHFNAFNGEASGMETYYNTKGNPWSKDVAETMLGSLKTGMAPSLTKVRGCKSGDLAILRGGNERYNKLPAALLEICFIDNSKDMDAYAKQEGTYSPKRAGSGKVSTQLAAGIANL